GAEPRLNERASELRRVTAPQRELAREIEAGGEVLAVLTHVLEEQVAEHETLDALALQRLERLRRPRLVDLVGAARRDLDLDQRQPERGALLTQQRAPHAVHADAVVRVRHGRDQRVHGEPPLAQHCIQRQRRVLAAAPPDRRPRQGGLHRGPAAVRRDRRRARSASRGVHVRSQPGVAARAATRRRPGASAEHRRRAAHAGSSSGSSSPSTSSAWSRSAAGTRRVTPWTDMPPNPPPKIPMSGPWSNTGIPSPRSRPAWKSASARLA